MRGKDGNKCKTDQHKKVVKSKNGKMLIDGSAENKNRLICSDIKSIKMELAKVRK